MAVKAEFGNRIVGGIVFGVIGAIFGHLLTATALFPDLEWAYIGLFLGSIYGLVKGHELFE